MNYLLFIKESEKSDSPISLLLSYWIFIKYCNFRFKSSYYWFLFIHKKLTNYLKNPPHRVRVPTLMTRIFLHPILTVVCSKLSWSSLQTRFVYLEPWTSRAVSSPYWHISVCVTSWFKLRQGCLLFLQIVLNIIFSKFLNFA